MTLGSVCLLVPSFLVHERGGGLEAVHMPNIDMDLFPCGGKTGG